MLLPSGRRIKVSLGLMINNTVMLSPAKLAKSCVAAARSSMLPRKNQYNWKKGFCI